MHAPCFGNLIFIDFIILVTKYELWISWMLPSSWIYLLVVTVTQGNARTTAHRRWIQQCIHGTARIRSSEIKWVYHFPQRKNFNTWWWPYRLKHVTGPSKEHLKMWDLRISWQWLWRMQSYGMSCRVVFARPDVSEERFASIIRVKRIS
jgi:hypothetical protein